MCWMTTSIRHMPWLMRCCQMTMMTSFRLALLWSSAGCASRAAQTRAACRAAACRCARAARCCGSSAASRHARGAKHRWRTMQWCDAALHAVCWMHKALTSRARGMVTPACAIGPYGTALLCTPHCQMPTWYAQFARCLCCALLLATGRAHFHGKQQCSDWTNGLCFSVQRLPLMKRCRTTHGFRPATTFLTL